MIEEEHQGGCLCGTVRYAVIGDPKPTGVCHCRYRQLRTGSAFGFLAYFEPDKFLLDKGELTHYNFIGWAGYENVKLSPIAAKTL